MNINNFRGELTDISAKKEALVGNSTQKHSLCGGFGLRGFVIARCVRTKIRETYFQYLQTFAKQPSSCKLSYVLVQVHL